MSKRPLFSIIIPTHNRLTQLRNCLQSICKLSYPRERFEVIVVDDGGKTPLENTVIEFKETLNIRLFTQKNSGPATARNTGAGKARGRFLAFLDDDCAPKSNWLEVIESHLLKKPKSVIGGRTINALSENPFSTASQLLIDYLYHYFFKIKNHTLSFITSNNMAISSECFHLIGGFNPSFYLAAAEDREFCNRCRYHGIEIVYVPDAVVYHTHHLTFKSFFKQHFNYGRGAFLFYKITGLNNGILPGIESLSFYLNLFRYPFLHARTKTALALLSLLVTSQVANAMGFFWEKVKYQKSGS